MTPQVTASRMMVEGAPINPAATLMECNRPSVRWSRSVSREYAMRLAFWRAGKGRAVEQAPTVEREAIQPAPAAQAPAAAYAPEAAPVAGDLDLRAIGGALLRNKRW